MGTKKKLIGRLALGAGVALALGLVLLAVGFLAMQDEQRRFVVSQKAEREATAERTRKYLTELARKIDSLPVDPSLVGEVESRYFDERAAGPMYVWAMDVGGGFLFGVPREAFSRLNAIYDRDVLPRLRDGVVLDRQTFLRNLVDENEELRPGAFSAEGTDEEEGAWERLRRYRRDGEGSLTLSTPLKTAEGAPLGSLYVKRGAPIEREYYRPDERLETLAGVGGGLAAVAFTFLWILLPTWVYVDGRERGVRRAPLFAFLTVISSFIGLVVYLISRPETVTALQCPGCGKEVNGGAFCPHCGRDLSASFCAACRYPLKPDWVFCPACRAEIKPQPPAAEPVETSA
jgi:hypothetical protein